MALLILDCAYCSRIIYWYDNKILVGRSVTPYKKVNIMLFPEEINWIGIINIASSWLSIK